MREEIVKFGYDMSIVGILTHKSEEKKGGDFCTILINAGLIHKIGPNRLYVQISRELAQKGIQSFRFDYSGQGDSEYSKTNKNLEEIKSKEIRQAMDAVKQNTGINKFVLIGFCSGAEDAYRVSLEDDRIIGILLIDGVYQDKSTLNSIYPLAQRRTIIRYYKKHVFNAQRWMKLLTGKSGAVSWNNLRFIVRMLVSVLKRILNLKKKETNNENMGLNTQKPRKFKITEWEKLFTRKVKIYMVFCEGNSAIDVFNLTISKQLENYKNNDLHIELIKDVDHTFTTEWSQKLLIYKILKWMESFSNFSK